MRRYVVIALLLSFVLGFGVLQAQAPDPEPELGDCGIENCVYLPQVMAPPPPVEWDVWDISASTEDLSVVTIAAGVKNVSEKIIYDVQFEIALYDDEELIATELLSPIVDEVLPDKTNRFNAVFSVEELRKPDFQYDINVISWKTKPAPPSPPVQIISVTEYLQELTCQGCTNRLIIRGEFENTSDQAVYDLRFQVELFVPDGRSIGVDTNDIQPLMKVTFPGERNFFQYILDVSPDIDRYEFFVVTWEDDSEKIYVPLSVEEFEVERFPQYLAPQITLRNDTEYPVYNVLVEIITDKYIESIYDGNRLDAQATKVVKAPFYTEIYEGNGPAYPPIYPLDFFDNIVQIKAYGIVIDEE